MFGLDKRIVRKNERYYYFDSVGEQYLPIKGY